MHFSIPNHKLINSKCNGIVAYIICLMAFFIITELNGLLQAAILNRFFRLLFIRIIENGSMNLIKKRLSIT